MKTIKTVLLMLSVCVMSKGGNRFEYGKVSRQLVPAPFQQLILDPARIDGEVVRTFGFIAMQGEAPLLVESSDGVRYHDPLSSVYLEVDDSLHGEKPDLLKMKGLYVLVEGRFAVQFADVEVLGTAFRGLTLTRVQILDDRWRIDE